MSFEFRLRDFQIPLLRIDVGFHAYIRLRYAWFKFR